MRNNDFFQTTGTDVTVTVTSVTNTSSAEVTLTGTDSTATVLDLTTIVDFTKNDWMKDICIVATTYINSTSCIFQNWNVTADCKSLSAEEISLYEILGTDLSRECYPVEEKLWLAPSAAP
jgi:hypothetical protein